MKTIEGLTMQSQEDILARLKNRTEGDPFGFEIGEYINALDYQHAKEYLKEDVTEETWAAAAMCTKEAVLEQMRKYYDFAWEKANDCRGISANRSILHYVAWIWLIGDHEFLAEIQKMYEDYHFYGKPILEKIGDRYGLEWKTLDNGERTNHG